MKVPNWTFVSTFTNNRSRDSDGYCPRYCRLDRAVPRFSDSEPYLVVPQRYWSPYEGSNPELMFTRHLLYPLSYRGGSPHRRLSLAWQGSNLHLPD